FLIDTTHPDGGYEFIDENVKFDYLYNDKHQLVQIKFEQGGTVMQDFEYDERGNLIRVSNTKLKYSGTAPENTQSFYPTIGFDDLAEILNWVPTNKSPDLRTEQIVTFGQDENGEDYVAGTFLFSNHTFENGKLVKLTIAPGGFESSDVTTGWNCVEVIDEIIQPD
ncbi:MAG TPA: hypothetical protein VEC37_17995, partial [Bacillota bacterium]|nr:hypothetical protein [Bacillota bacterium]